MNKKKLIIAVLCAVLIIALGIVIFAHGGVEVTDKQIEDRMLYNKIHNEAYKICFEHNPEEYKKVELPTEPEKVKEQLQFDITVCDLLSEKKILMDTSESNSIAAAEYEALQYDPQQATFKEALFKVLKQENVSEQRYLELASEKAYYIYNTLNLKRDFEHTEYDQNQDKDFETQFEEYVKENMPFSIF